MPLSQKATPTPTSKAKALGNKEGQKQGAQCVAAAVCLDNANLVIDGMTLLKEGASVGMTLSEKD
jgi:hypothetical protein